MRKVARQGGNGVDKVVGPDPAVAGRGRGSDLDQGPRVVPNHLDLVLGVRIPILLGDQLHEADSNTSLWSNKVLDGDVGQRGGLLLLATDEERSEFRSNGLGLRDGRHLDVVGHWSPLVAVGPVLDEDDRHVLAHKGT